MHRNNQENSLLSNEYTQDPDIEEIPRVESQHTTTVTQHAPPDRGIELDQVNPNSPLTRSMAFKVPRGEVQRREMDPIQPVQLAEKQPNTALSLRLDLNLDIEIELKARISGDLTLSLFMGQSI
ncbi:hypothetical protein N7488_000308 [Penicillium malachiteum]|nr:hypothetical protein N7488_000308 [Penicillium malachiteum]